MIPWPTCLLAALGVATVGCQIAPPVAPGVASDAPRAGVKPRFVRCDPARPELPCTPNTAPPFALRRPASTPPGVKPERVPCDPARPDLPCTPDPSRLLRAAPGSVARLGAGRPAAEVRGCAADADCVVSCRVDGACCPEVCGCTQVYNRAFLAALTAHQSGCATAGCDQLKCTEYAPPYTAACVSGRCVARRAGQ